MLIDQSYRMVLVVVSATILASCGNSQRILGTVELRGQEQKILPVQVPASVEAETGWRLRFGILPSEHFDSLKASDRVTVYLENADNVSVDFLKHLDKIRVESLPKGKVTIGPNERTELYQGAVSGLVMNGRGEEAAMVFAPMKRNVNYRLHIVPNMSQEDTATLQISLFYYPSVL